VQTDSLEGSSVALDDSSPENLENLVETAKELLEDPVSDRDFETGELVPIPGGPTNRQALAK
jgi:hypothetical protein